MNNTFSAHSPNDDMPILLGPSHIILIIHNSFIEHYIFPGLFRKVQQASVLFHSSATSPHFKQLQKYFTLNDGWQRCIFNIKPSISESRPFLQYEKSDISGV